MASFVKRTGRNGSISWLVQVCITTGGRRTIISRTSKSPRKKDAIALARTLEAERDQGTLVRTRHTIGSLLDDLLVDYRINGKNLAWASIVAAHLRPHFGHIAADKLDTATVQRYVAARLEEGAAHQTVNHDLALLHRAYVLGANCTPPKVGRVPRIQKLRVDNARKGFFELPEYEVLFARLPEELRPLLAFGYYTGCRRAEILGLRWTQVDLGAGLVRLEPGETKNKDGRTIPLAPALRKLLAMQLAVRERYWPDTPWVFFRHSTGGRIISFRDTWKAACREAGLWEGDEETGKPTKLFHDLRRSAVRDMVRAGTPEAVAMRVSGHRTRAMFDRYNIVSEADLHQAADRLGKYRSARTETKSPSKVHHLGQAAQVQ